MIVFVNHDECGTGHRHWRCAKTLRDLALVDFLALCDPAGDPLQGELIRRLQIMRTRLNQVVAERGDVYAHLEQCQDKLDRARQYIDQLLSDKEVTP